MNILNSYRVKTWVSPSTDEVYLSISYMEDNRIFIASPINLEFKEHKIGMRSNPTLILPSYLAEDFLNAFAEALDDAGIKTDKDAKLAGTLEATRLHLEDMRTMAMKSFNHLIRR